MSARRDFLKKLSLAAGAGVGIGSGLYSMNSFSAGLTGYKALIVIHLSGGNDANDIPTVLRCTPARQKVLLLPTDLGNVFSY